MGLPLESQSQLEQDVTTFWTLLFAIVTDGEKRLAAHMAAHGLTPPQLYVLKTLSECDGRCPIGAIAQQHHLTNATMTGIVSRLEAQDPPLVMRERSPVDRRSVDVVLTPAGVAKFNDFQEDLLFQLRTALSLVDTNERQALIHFLTRYVNMVTELFPVEQIKENTVK